MQMMSSNGFVPLQDRVFLESTEINPLPVSSMSGNSSEPKVPPDSPGSSVSSRLQVVNLSHPFYSCDCSSKSSNCVVVKHYFKDGNHCTMLS